MKIKIGEIELKLKDSCDYCNPNIEQLLEILEEFNNRQLPRDVKLTIELNSDWLGEESWHLDKVSIEKRKFDGEKE